MTLASGAAGALSTGALVTGVVVALLVGLLLGTALGLVVGRRGTPRARTGGALRTGGASPAGAPTGPLLLDDLPGFLEHPPGSPLPDRDVPAPRELPAAAGSPGTRPADASARTTLLIMAAAAVLLVAIAVLVALLSDQGQDGAGAPAASAGPSAAPSPPVRDGLAATATFTGLVLHERAAGVTVTRPSLSVTTDGGQARAHVGLPTWNCLTREAPPDPPAAGCAPSVTEFADLAAPQLRLVRDGDRVELTGLVATYTQPAGSPPVATGHAYRLSATLAAAGPAQDGRTPATGVVRIGPATSVTTAEPGANVLEFRG